jgi:hypothetical protein
LPTWAFVLFLCFWFFQSQECLNAMLSEHLWLQTECVSLQHMWVIVRAVLWELRVWCLWIWLRQASIKLYLVWASGHKVIFACVWWAQKFCNQWLFVLC